MRSRYKWDAQGNLIYAMERGVVTVDKRYEDANDPGYYVVPDCEPHRNMVTGEIVTSKARHKEILKDYGLVEMGNDPRAFQPRPTDIRKTGQREAIISAVQQAKEKYGARHIERSISEALNKAHEFHRNRR